MTLDFIFGLPKDKREHGVVTYTDRCSKRIVLAAISKHITATDRARPFFGLVVCHHGLPNSVVSDRDPRFTSHFWRSVFALCGTRLQMSSADHPESDGHSERSNRIVEDIVHSFALARLKTWSVMLQHVGYVYNTSIQASSGFSPYFTDHLRHPRLPTHVGIARLCGGESRLPADIPPRTTASVRHFLATRESVLRQVRENTVVVQARQARNANRINRTNTSIYHVNDLVLLHTSIYIYPQC